MWDFCHLLGCHWCYFLDSFVAAAFSFLLVVWSKTCSLCSHQLLGRLLLGIYDVDGRNWYVRPSLSVLLSTVATAGGTRFAFYGDQVPMRETALVIANHQSYSDWLSSKSCAICSFDPQLTVFALSMRKGRMGTQKFFAKDVIRYIPGFGWGIWLLGSVFLSRNCNLEFPFIICLRVCIVGQKDMKIIHDMFAHLNYLNCGFWLTLFAEGTRLTPEKLAERFVGLFN